MLKRAEIEREEVEGRLARVLNEAAQLREILQDRDATIVDLESRLEHLDYAYNDLQAQHSHTQQTMNSIQYVATESLTALRDELA